VGPEGLIVDKRYELYCLADPQFYDSPVAPQTGHLDYPIAARELPPGWRRHEQDDWVVLAPTDLELPRQGWKIHVSACLDNAEEVLDEVWSYCVPRGLSFKFLRARHVLHMRNAKYASRGSSGKLVTIYPADERALEQVLTELDAILGGRQGPYILSDLRWADGPLYVRYGGFAPRYCMSDRGILEPAIEDPDGVLVPDRRGAVFTTPSWVRLPAFLEPHLKARSATTVTAMPYQVERVLHFSNGGGVYVAVETGSGEQVVLKEARPHAGLAYDGADAVSRLEREYSIMERLRGLPAVPRVRDRFTLGDHHFLVMDLVEGEPLNQMFSERYPLSDPTAAAERAGPYTEWALGVYARVEEAIAGIHDRGVIFGDLHPFNIMVRPDDSVALIDYEVASLVGDGRQRSLAHPGFAAPQDREGFDIDRYALACLRLALFLPVTTLLVLDRGKAAHFAEIIAANFPVSRDFLAEAVETICTAGPEPAAEKRSSPSSPSNPPRTSTLPSPSTLPKPPSTSARTAGTNGQTPQASRHTAEATGAAGNARHPVLTPDLPGWERARASLRAAILASATPDRDDRLFPGDIEQFATGGLNLAHGAAGVLYALEVAGAGRYPDYEDWLARQALRPGEGTRLGVYDGLHGVAYVLDHLGHRDTAMEIVDICLREKWERLGLDLGGGVAGIGLNLRHLAERTGESALRAGAERAAEIVAERLGAEDDVPETSGGDRPHAGLLEGSAGPALLLIRMYEDTGDEAWLDRARIALGQDLRRCVTRPDGTLHVNEGWRTVPYLHRGGAGIALVLDEYLAHRRDERFDRASAAIYRGVRSPFTIQSGLFNGRAGILAYLAWRAAGPPGQPPGLGGRACDHPDVALQVRNLAWHAMTYRGHLAFPGDQLYRLSMDLATGSAGVLFALGTALHGEPVSLPFLGRAPGGSPGHPPGDSPGRPAGGERPSRDVRNP
jgi:serine/threonine protein kinase